MAEPPYSWMASPPPPYIPTKLALRKLYEATGGSTWTYNANWLSGDPCGSSENGNTPWQVANNLPIGCTDGFPSTIYLNDNRLQGTLPTEIGLLRSPIGSLNINLRNNRISGTIPTELGNLQAFDVLSLRLDLNRLSGAIPSQLGLLQAGGRSFCYLTWSDATMVTNHFACPVPFEAILGISMGRKMQHM